MSESSERGSLFDTRRIDGLLNLRKGYGSTVAAVGFWLEMEGEDIIDLYVEAATAVRAYEDALEHERSLSNEMADAAEAERDSALATLRVAVEAFAEYALNERPIPERAIADFTEGFRQDAYTPPSPFAKRDNERA